MVLITITDSSGDVTQHNDTDYLARTGMMPLKVAQKDNPYLDAFWRWWPELYKNLEVFQHDWRRASHGLQHIQSIGLHI